MGKFKDLVLNENEKDRLDEAVGGVVSTPAINGGHGVTGQKSDAEMSGDSRIDTRGNFTFDSSELPSGNTDSDFSKTPNPRQAFGELNESPESVVLHEDDGGSVVIRETSDGQEIIIRAGSQERAFELDEEAAKKVRAFFG